MTTAIAPTNGIATARRKKPATLGAVVALDPTLIDRDAGQPRQEFDTVAQRELEESVRSLGVIQPLEVVDMQNGRYRLLTGERRLRAALVTGQKLVPVIVKNDPPTWKEARTRQLIENTQRKDLTPLEFWQTVKLLWLSDQVESLELEQGEDGSITAAMLSPDDVPTVQIAVLTDRLIALTGLPNEEGYLSSGAIRVPWQTALERVGLGQMTPAQRKKGLQVLDVSPAVQDMLAGIDVSARTLRELSKHDQQTQADLVGAAKDAISDNGGVGDALRQALDTVRPSKQNGAAENGLDDSDVWRPEDRAEGDPLFADRPQFDTIAGEREGGDNFVPDPALALPSGPAGNAARLVTDRPPPERGSTPPAGHDVWSRDDVMMLESGMEGLLEVFDRVGPRNFTDAQRDQLGVMWRELVELMRAAGLEA